MSLIYQVSIQSFAHPIFCWRGGGFIQAGTTFSFFLRPTFWGVKNESKSKLMLCLLCSRPILENFSVLFILHLCVPVKHVPLNNRKSELLGIFATKFLGLHVEGAFRELP